MKALKLELLLSTALLITPTTVFSSEESLSDRSEISTPCSDLRSECFVKEEHIFQIDNNWHQTFSRDLIECCTFKVHNPCAGNFEFFERLSSELEKLGIRPEYNIHIHGRLGNIKKDLEALATPIKRGYFTVKTLDCALFLKPEEKEAKEYLFTQLLDLEQPHLKELRLRFCGLTDQEMCRNAPDLIKIFKNLEKLNFAFNDLTEDFMLPGAGFSQFVQGCESLNEFNLRGNRIGGDNTYRWPFKTTPGTKANNDCPKLVLDFNPILTKCFEPTRGISTMSWCVSHNKTWTADQREFWIEYLAHQGGKSNLDRHLKWQAEDRLPLEDWCNHNNEFRDQTIIEDFGILAKHSSKIGRFKQIDASFVKPDFFDRFLEFLDPNILHLTASKGDFPRSPLNRIKGFRQLRVLDLSGSNIARLDKFQTEEIAYPYLQQLVWQGLNFEDNLQFCFIFEKFLGITAKTRLPKLRTLDFGKSTGLSIDKICQIVASLLPASVRTVLLYQSRIPADISEIMNLFEELVKTLEEHPIDFLDLTQSFCVSGTTDFPGMQKKIEGRSGLKTLIGLTYANQNKILMPSSLLKLRDVIEHLSSKILDHSGSQKVTWTDQDLQFLVKLIGQIDPLSLFSNLIQFGLKGQGVSDAGIEAISRIKGLRFVDLEGCCGTDSVGVNRLIEALSPDLMHLNVLGQNVCCNSVEDQFEFSGKLFNGFILKAK